MQLKYFRSKGITNMDQIEKFIETQKVKHKHQGNSYEKNYTPGGLNHQKQSTTQQQV
jgi:hypothetical protein